MQPSESNLIVISDYLEKLKIDFDLYFEDLESGLIFESGKKMAYPFASCFKLAVLATVLEKFTDDELCEMASVNERDVPKLAIGVMNSLEMPISLSRANMLRLMMAFSDGACTDILIREVGLESVRKFILSNTSDSNILHDVNGLLKALLKASLTVTSNPYNITRNEYLASLESTTMKQDYSTSKDLAALLKVLLSMGPRAHQYLFRDQAIQRLGMYSLDNVRLYGKTGTLGYWVSANDCAVVVVNGEPRAVVGLMTLGWEQPRYIIEHAFGEVGLMISNFYRTKPVYSAAFGSE